MIDTGRERPKITITEDATSRDPHDAHTTRTHTSTNTMELREIGIILSWPFFSSVVNDLPADLPQVVFARVLEPHASPVDFDLVLGLEEEDGRENLAAVS